jgi:hypothetical protein
MGMGACETFSKDGEKPVFQGGSQNIFLQIYVKLVSDFPHIAFQHSRWNVSFNYSYILVLIVSAFLSFFKF